MKVTKETTAEEYLNEEHYHLILDCDKITHGDIAQAMEDYHQAKLNVPSFNK